MPNPLSPTLESPSRRPPRVREHRWCKAHCAECDRCFTGDQAFDAHIVISDDHRHADLALEHVTTRRYELAPLAGKCRLWNGANGRTRETTLWEWARITNAR